MSLPLYDRATHAARYWLLRNLPTCRQLAPVMSESLERPLSFRERVTMRLHLWVCIWCVRYLEQLHVMRETLRAREAQVSNDESAADATLPAEARERIKDALRRDGI
ncbi:MAG: zf-HC2 domain-containing protein [Pyrinomonadaceae bacterium]